MNHEEFKSKLDKVIEILENAQRSAQFTNIPTHVIAKYIETETGINIEDVKLSIKP